MVTLRKLTGTTKPKMTGESLRHRMIAKSKLWNIYCDLSNGCDRMVNDPTERDALIKRLRSMADELENIDPKEVADG